MEHLIGYIPGIIVFVLFFRWYKGQEFKLFHVIVEIIVTGILFYMGYNLNNYVSKNVQISIPLNNRIPEEVKNWFGFTLFFIGSCTLSIKSWIHFNKQKRVEKSDTY